MVDKVRAKFTCESVEKFTQSERVKLHPVTSGSEEDNTYSKYTPSGKLDLDITNEAVHGFFEPGKAYYLDITPAE